LYNHYRDKESVLRALCEHELARLVEIAHTSTSATSALQNISIQVSSDKALASMRVQDPEYYLNPFSTKMIRYGRDSQLR